MTINKMPNEKDVRDTLSGLLFRDCAIAPGEPVVPAPAAPVTIGVYVDDRLATAAVVVADLALSAYAGAAIGLIPPGGAKAAIEDKELSPTVKENLDEVLNVLASLFNAKGEPHVRLYKTYGLRELPPNDILAVTGQLVRRLDVAVSIAGYGKGHLSIVLA